MTVTSMFAQRVDCGMSIANTQLLMNVLTGYCGKEGLREPPFRVSRMGILLATRSGFKREDAGMGSRSGAWRRMSIDKTSTAQDTLGFERGSHRYCYDLLFHCLVVDCRGRTNRRWKTQRSFSLLPWLPSFHDLAGAGGAQ